MNKITKEFLESEIVDVTYTRLKGTITHCAITVKSGFTFTGESACVDEASFNKEIGEKFAYEQAFEKMWLPYGFWLKQSLNDGVAVDTYGWSNNTDVMDFGVAITYLKRGAKVARKGWNGKGMWLLLVDGKCVTEVINDCYGDPHRHEVDVTGYEKGQSIPVLDAIYMKTADNKLVPWLASQTDMLAEDWVIVE